MGSSRLINDPGLLPWFIVAAYAVDALLASFAARAGAGRERTFWIAVAVSVAFLGVNKQLDLQTDLTQIARAVAKADRTYSWRRDLQGSFLLLIFLASAATLGFLIFWLRDSPITVKCALIGVALLFAFVFIRAAVFHHISYWLPIERRGGGDPWFVEFVANFVTGSAAWLYYRRRTPSPDSPRD